MTRDECIALLSKHSLPLPTTPEAAKGATIKAVHERRLNHEVVIVLEDNRALVTEEGRFMNLGSFANYPHGALDGWIEYCCQLSGAGFASGDAAWREFDAIRERERKARQEDEERATLAKLKAKYEPAAQTNEPEAADTAPAR